MVQIYRMFDGKRYTWAGYARTKAEAERRKAKMKEEGFKVRLVKMLGTSIRAPPERGKHTENVWFIYERGPLADR
ncbi:MAG: hypothetical protein WC277_11945 [Bacilli bacterium]